MIQYAIACGLASIDLTPTRTVSKTRWRPREVAYVHAVQFCAGRRARGARLLYRLSQGGGAGLAVLGPLLRPFKRQRN